MKTHIVFGRIRILLLLTFVVAVCGLSGERKVKSAVTAVTVYSDRAVVTRTAREQLAAGEHIIVFTDLPSSLDDRSLRVTGDAQGQTRILDVKSETVFLDTIPEDRIRQLQDRLKLQKYEEQSLSNRQSVLRSQMSLVDSLRIYSARDPKNLTAGQKNQFDEWDKILSFMDRNLTSLYGKMLETTGKLEDVRSRIDATTREIAQSRGYSKKSMKEVRVTLRVAAGGPVRLELSYLISSANWSPQYEARVSSESASLQLIYSGSIAQSTGEDWDDVDLTLSTAQPSSGAAPGTLYPWAVDIVKQQYSVGRSTARMRTQVEPLGKGAFIRGTVKDKGNGQPLVGVNVFVEGTSVGAASDMSGRFLIHSVSPGVHAVRASYIGYEPFSLQNVRVNQDMSVWIDFELSESPIQVSEVAVTAAALLKSENVARDIRAETAEVRTQATSAIFKIASRATIPSDNNSHKVGIAMENLPVAFQYVTIPKLSPSAYLQGRVKNNTEYPFLTGTMSVFFDNSFVATSEINTTFPQEEFESYFGVDEAVRIERRIVNRFTEYTGTFSRKVKVTYDVLLSVQNLKTKEVKLSLQDQIPISKNEKIVIEQLEPDVKLMPADPSGMLTWNLLLKPSQKSAQKLKFSVEYPREIQVAGLE